MANFSLLASLGLNSTAFQNGMSGASSKVEIFKKALATVTPILAGLGLSQVAREAINLGSRLSDLSTQLNIDVESLQALQFATQEAGVKSQTLERALRNVQLRTQEAINGNKSYSDAFEKLGINIEEFSKLDTAGKFEEIARAQAQAEDKQAAYAATARILGERAGPELQEVLQRIASEGFNKVEESARKAGQIMSGEAIQSMDLLADRVEQLKTRMTNLAAEIINNVLDAFNKLREAVIADYDTMTLQELVAAQDDLASKTRLTGRALEANREKLREVREQMGEVTAAEIERARALNKSEAELQSLLEKEEELSQVSRMRRGQDQESFEKNRDERAELLEATREQIKAVEDNIEKLKEEEKAAVQSLENQEGAANNTAGAVANIGQQSANATNAIASNTVSVVANLNSTKKSAELASGELNKIAKLRMGILTTEIQGVEMAIGSVEQKIAGTKGEILSLNQSNLDSLLATFGVTAKGLGEELERQITASGKSASDLSSDEMERAYRLAISNIRQEMRQELGDGAFEESFSNVMPGEQELNDIINLFRTVSDQSAALATAPDTIQSLTSELEGHNEELDDLLSKQSTLQTEIDDLDGSMDSLASSIDSGSDDIESEAAALSTALSNKAQEISEIVIPDADTGAGSNLMDGVHTRLDTANNHLNDIKTSLQGKFVNQ